MVRYKTIEDAIGHTPLVRLTRIPGADNERRGNVILDFEDGVDRIDLSSVAGSFGELSITSLNVITIAGESVSITVNGDVDLTADDFIF